MKKLFLLLVFLIGCSNEDERASWKDILPKSAVIYKVDNSGTGGWAYWKYNNECFLSTYYYTLVITKVDCK